MSRRQSSYFWLVKIFSTIIIILSVIYAIFSWGTELETRFAPVVGKLEILSIGAGPDGKTRVKVAFRKLRDCEYFGIVWLKKNVAGAFEPVAVELLRAPGDIGSPNRPLGRHIAGPWLVSLSPDEILKVSYVNVYHRCHPFWLTRTQIYP